MTDEVDVVRLIAVCKSRPGLEEELRKELLATIAVALAEPGCLEFTLHVDRNRPSEFVFYEAWESQAALDRHFATPDFKALGAKFERLLAESVFPTLLQKIG